MTPLARGIYIHSGAATSRVITVNERTQVQIEGIYNLSRSTLLYLSRTKLK